MQMDTAVTVHMYTVVLIDIEYRYCCITTIDINECATNMGGCEQRCVNTPGGFHCTCNSGYTLNSDGITCTGMGLS